MKLTTSTRIPLSPKLQAAWEGVDNSFERFCLTAGIEAIEQMLCEDARQLAGAPHSRGCHRAGHRWGTTKGKIGFHGGKACATWTSWRLPPAVIAAYASSLRSVGSTTAFTFRLSTATVGSVAFVSEYWAWEFAPA